MQQLSTPTGQKILWLGKPGVRCSIFNILFQVLTVYFYFFLIHMNACAGRSFFLCVSVCVCTCFCIQALVVCPVPIGFTNKKFSSNGLHNSGEWKMPPPRKQTNKKKTNKKNNRKRKSVKIVQHENTIARYEESERKQRNTWPKTPPTNYFTDSLSATT